MEKPKTQFESMLESLFGSRRGVIWVINKIAAFMLIVVFIAMHMPWYASVAIFLISLFYDGTYVGYLSWEKIETKINVEIGK
jgi:hypothetical protein